MNRAGEIQGVMVPTAFFSYICPWMSLEDVQVGEHVPNGKSLALRVTEVVVVIVLVVVVVVVVVRVVVVVILECELNVKTKTLGDVKQTYYLGGGLKHFLFTPLPGEMIQFD